MTTAVDRLAFDSERHVYQLDGVVVPSVTQVLRSTGYIDLSAVPAAVLETARARGQRVHQALHFLFEDDLDEDSVDDAVRGYLQSARRYIETNIRTVRRAEFRVCSTRYGFAGTLDLLAVHTDGFLSVDDFKTGQPDDVAADLQTAAYLGALLEMTSADAEFLHDLRRDIRPPVVKRRSIRLFGDGRIAREGLYQDHRDYQKFLTALAVVHDQAKRRPAVAAWDDER